MPSLVLTSSDSLELYLASGITTSNPTFVTSWIDKDTDTPGGFSGTLNGTSHVVVVPAPTSGTRLVLRIDVFNADTVPVTVLASKVTSSTGRIFLSYYIKPGESATILEPEAKFNEALLAKNNLSDLESASIARTNIGLGNVDNTSDANKPVSTAQATAITAQVFAAVALTNPYSATTPLTPRYLGDIAINTTSLEIWQAQSAAAAATSWNVVSRGYYGGVVLPDAHAFNYNGFFSCLSTAANVPDATENWLFIQGNSNLGTTGASLLGIGLTTGQLRYQLKSASVWGAWTDKVTPVELSKLAGIGTTTVKAQLDALDTSIKNLDTSIKNLDLRSLMADSGRGFGPSLHPFTLLDTPSATKTATTLSFDSTTSTLNDSASGLSSFTAGMLLNISGSTSNNFQVLITTATSASLTLRVFGSDAIVTEAAGSSVTLTASSLTAQTWFSPYAGSTAWVPIGKFINNNTTNGGTGGVINPIVSTLLVAMGRTGARYGSNFIIEETTIGTTGLVCVNAAKPMFWINGGASFGGWACYDGSDGTIASGRYTSLNNGAWTTGAVTLTAGTWYFVKVHGTATGYDSGFPGFAGIAGGRLRLALPMFTSGIIPNISWITPLPAGTPSAQ